MASLDPRFDGQFSNEWYWNPHMEPLLAKHRDKIAVWHHGHTHATVDVVVDGVRIVTNPRGYPGENPGWKPLTMRSEEHTSELQSLMRISYAVFCLKKKIN